MEASGSTERRVSHYRIVGSVGSGGMGEVYAAFDETLKRRVALKAIRQEHRLSADAKARFIREARLLSQLDHPHVCRVYDYVEDGDQEWLVLELIDGTNLRDLMARGLDARQKMRIAEQIASVLVATHAAGVVHRDLKPANVMVTTSGDVKVLDFGLAQPVNRFADAPAADAAPPGPDSPIDQDIEVTRTSARSVHGADLAQSHDGASVFRTQKGSVSGTVAYMSPEQAMGSPATTASDMYSFGLLLQELFAGSRAFHQGLNVAELLDRVRRADTPAPVGLASDLTSLIRRLKSAPPSQRPTAVEARQLLQSIRTKPARRIRQLVVASVITAAVLGAAKYTFDLARERAVAVAARADADSRRMQAETLIGFMLGDLRTKLQQVGRLDMLEDVGREATSYFKAVPVEALSDEELYRRSQSMYQIGQVHQAKGNLVLATDAYRDSLNLIREVTARAPDNADWQLGLGTAHFYVGDALRRQGDVDGALEHFRSYWQVAERLVARDPANQAWRLEVAFGHSNVAGVLEAKGDLKGARAELDTTLSLKQQVSDSAPENVEWRRTLASTHNRLGVVLHKLGQLRDAAKHYRRDLEIQETLLARSPNNAQLQLSSSIARGWLGTVLDDLGEVDEAVQHHRARFAITSALVDRDPANSDWRREHETTRMRLAEAEWRSGQVAAAEAGYNAALTTLNALLEKNPTRVTLRRDVATGHLRVARFHVSSGRAPLAAEEARTCQSVLVPLVSSPKPDQELVALSAHCRLQLGAALAAGKRRGEADAEWRRALEIIEPIARASPDPARLQLWARALRRVGRQDEANAITEKILATGYRNRLFLEELNDITQRR